MMICFLIFPLVQSEWYFVLFLNGREERNVSLAKIKGERNSRSRTAIVKKAEKRESEK